MSDFKLTAKQEAFCREYIIDFNASRAALKAGYSEKTAYAIGFENLKKPEIASFIADIVQAKTEKADIDADFVLKGIRDIATGGEDTRDSDKLKAFELLGKYLALFTDKVDVKISDAPRFITRPRSERNNPIEEG